MNRRIQVNQASEDLKIVILGQKTWGLPFSGIQSAKWKFTPYFKFSG